MKKTNENLIDYQKSANFAEIERNQLKSALK